MGTEGQRRCKEDSLTWQADMFRTFIFVVGCCIRKPQHSPLLLLFIYLLLLCIYLLFYDIQYYKITLIMLLVSGHNIMADLCILYHSYGFFCCYFFPLQIQCTPLSVRYIGRLNIHVFINENNQPHLVGFCGSDRVTASRQNRFSQVLRCLEHRY